MDSCRRAQRLAMQDFGGLRLPELSPIQPGLDESKERLKAKPRR